MSRLEICRQIEAKVMKDYKLCPDCLSLSSKDNRLLFPPSALKARIPNTSSHTRVYDRSSRNRRLYGDQAIGVEILNRTDAMETKQGPFQIPH